VTWHENLEAKASSEASIIIDAFAAHHIAIAGVATDDGWIEYLYAEHQLLAREHYLEQIREVLRDRGQAEARVVKRVIRDIVLLEIEFLKPDAASDGDGETTKREPPSLLELLDDIDARLGPGIATPNHVVTTAGGSPSGCPATEPQEVYDPTPYPAPCQGKAGEGVRIYVADTGFVTSAVGTSAWLNGVTGDSDPSVSANGVIQPYGGHGTFVAGVIRCLAPGAEILVKAVFDIAGSALESDFVPKLHEGFKFGADIFHVTVASQTRWNLPLIAFEAWLNDLRGHKGVVCIVPAGNNSSRQPCWPAAFPEVISVGALATDQRSVAYFSNFGGWVDVYAPGQNLVNAFVSGEFTCQVSPFNGQVRTFTGRAQWSGTSFSTPIVTGLIAARMGRCGDSGRDAAAALLGQARKQTIRGVGPVLLPGCDGEDCGCGGGVCGRGHGGCGCGDGCGCG